MNTQVKAQDFFDRMRKENQSFRLLSDNISSDDTVLSGTFRRTTVRQGLTVHYSDVINLCDLSTESEMHPHLGIKLFFQGGVAASIGDRDIPMARKGARDGRWIPSATLFSQKHRESFRRRAQIGDRVRKFTIRIFPEWLESGDVFGHSDALALKAFTAEHLASMSWNPSPLLIALAEQAMRPPQLQPFMQKLYLESRTLGIIAEAFGRLASIRSAPAGTGSLRSAERKRLERAEEWLRGSRGCLPTVEELAAEAGVSVNTLQRLFHIAHGTTVFNYVRQLKLEEARLALETEGLSIAQAAFLAGYTSTANFSTAFKRQYGFSPKEARTV
ncbi:AraC family transcriptional regulator [Pararhizobium sp. A13]|uniref:helix-turn-helix transcriptional regulator n=1 Tax=Pararhizobium sp. A13 TaxID=3133975 RepID=UPI00311AFF64